jgi:hypothetical protein
VVQGWPWTKVRPTLPEKKKRKQKRAGSIAQIVPEFKLQYHWRKKQKIKIFKNAGSKIKVPIYDNKITYLPIPVFSKKFFLFY